MKLMTLFSVVSLVAVAACGGEAGTVSTEVGVKSGTVRPAGSISRDRLALIEPQLQAEVDAGIRSGFVAVVGHGGKVVYETAVGMADLEAAKPMTMETQFRIASMSKPLTSVAIMMLVERGELLLTDPVGRYIPSFASLPVASSHMHGPDSTLPTEEKAGPITIHQLLTHTAGLGYIFDGETDLGQEMIDGSLYTLQGDLAARIEALSQYPLYTHPGTEWRYSYATDVLGRVVEVVSGKSLEVFMREEVFKPLNMENTGFYLDGPDFSRLAVVYEFNDTGEMVRTGRRGLTPDPNSEAAGWASGGGGLASTAGDYMRFMQMLLNEGELDGVRLLSPATIRLMASSHVSVEKLKGSFMEGQGEGFGLGFSVVTDPGIASKVTSTGQYGWGGYYDTVFWVDPAHDLGVIVMTQRIPGPNVPKSRVREIVNSIAYGALE